MILHMLMRPTIFSDRCSPENRQSTVAGLHIIPITLQLAINFFNFLDIFQSCNAILSNPRYTLKRRYDLISESRELVLSKTRWCTNSELVDKRSARGEGYAESFHGRKNGYHACINLHVGMCPR